MYNACALFGRRHPLLVVALSVSTFAPLARGQEAADPLLTAVLTAPDAQLETALEKLFLQRLKVGVTYPGQYESLRKRADDLVPILHGWATKAPDALASYTDAARQGAIHALRDLHPGEAPAETMTLLRTIADADTSPIDTRNAAVYALYGFGDKKRLETKLEKLRATIKTGSPRQKVSAHLEAADIRYATAEYRKAADHYAEVATIVEKAKITELPAAALHYNRACFLARAGATEEALAALERALRKRTDSVTDEMLDSDRDLDALRALPRFKEVVQRYRDGG